jgi:hypothetical protein
VNGDALTLFVTQDCSCYLFYKSNRETLVTAAVLSRRALLQSTSMTAIAFTVGGCWPWLSEVVDEVANIYKKAYAQAQSIYGTVKSLFPSLVLPANVQTAITSINGAMTALYTAYQDIAQSMSNATKDRVASIIDAVYQFFTAVKDIATAAGALGGGPIFQTAAAALGTALNVGVQIAKAFGYPLPASATAALAPTPAAAPAPPVGLALAAPIPSPALALDAAFKAAATAPPDQAKAQLAS